MEKITEKMAIEIFSSSKKTLKLLDKTLKKDNCEFFIASREKGSYTVYGGDKQEICSTGSVYNSLVGLLYFNYGVGKPSSPSWAMFQGEQESNFEQ